MSPSQRRVTRRSLRLSTSPSAGPRRSVLRSSTFGAAALDSCWRRSGFASILARRAHFPVVLPPPPRYRRARPASPSPRHSGTDTNLELHKVGLRRGGAAALAVAVIVLGGTWIGSRSSSDRARNLAQSVPAQVGESPTDDPASSGSTRQFASGAGPLHLLDPGPRRVRTKGILSVGRSHHGVHRLARPRRTRYHHDVVSVRP